MWHPIPPVVLGDRASTYFPRLYSVLLLFFLLFFFLLMFLLTFLTRQPRAAGVQHPRVSGRRGTRRGRSPRSITLPKINSPRSITP